MSAGSRADVLEPGATVRVPIATDAQGHEVRPADGGQGPFRCIDCGTVVSLRRAHERRGHPVRAHFAHHPNIQCAFSEGESELHLRAKERIKALVEAGSPMTLLRHCRTCDAPIKERLSARVVQASLEHQLSSGRRADVALLDADGRVFSVIEVFETHAVDQNKRIDLADAHWCEIKAATILDGNDWALVQDHLAKVSCAACQFTELRPWQERVQGTVLCPLPDAGAVVAVENCSACACYVSVTAEGIRCWGAHAS